MNSKSGRNFNPQIQFRKESKVIIILAAQMKMFPYSV